MIKEAARKCSAVAFFEPQKHCGYKSEARMKHCEKQRKGKGC